VEDEINMSFKGNTLCHLLVTAKVRITRTQILVELLAGGAGMPGFARASATTTAAVGDRRC
jgi:hypothetical protein